MLRKLVTALIAVFMLLVVTPVAHAGDKGHALNPKVLGKTYGEWSAEWWKWAVAGPAGANAVEDSDGTFCDANQPDGPVWFLAGSFGVPDVERHCTIPANKALFYPLANGVWIDCPESGDADLTNEEVRGIMAELGGGGNFACELTSSIGRARSARWVRDQRSNLQRADSRGADAIAGLLHVHAGRPCLPGSVRPGPASRRNRPVDRRGILGHGAAPVSWRARARAARWQL